MKNIEEKIESKLKRIVKNLDVLVPFKCVFMDGDKTPRKKMVNLIYSFVLAMGYFPLAFNFGANPLNWSQEMRKQEQEKVKDQADQKAFPLKLYQKLNGADGVMDYQEFKNFYERVEKTGGIYYPGLKDIIATKK